MMTLLLLALLWTTPAWASEAHAPSIHDIWFPLINFLIFLFLIKRFGGPVIGNYFRTRHEEIARAVTGGAAEREAAEAKAQEYRDRLARLKEEVRKVHETFIAEGEREKTRLLAEAQAQAAKLKADADFLAGQEMKVAQLQLRQEIAQMVHETAAAAIRSHVTAQDHKRLVDEFVAGLGGVR